MIKKITLLMLLMIFQLVIVLSEEKEIITIDAYMTIIKEKLPDLKQLQNKLKQSENDIYRANAMHDVNMNASFQGTGNKNYSSSSGYELDYTKGFQTDLNFSTTLPSGTRLSVGGDYSQMYSSGSMTQGTTTQDFENVNYDPIIKIGISQPLIYNWFGFLDRFGKRNALLQYEINKLQTDENTKSLLLYYKKLYFIWIEDIKMIDYLTQTVNNSDILKKQMANKLSLRIAENDDYQRSVYSLLKSQEQLDSVTRNYHNLQKELGLFFDINKYKPDMSHLGKVFSQITDFKEKYKPFEDTRSAEIIKLSQTSQEELKKANFNKTLPQLNIFGNVSIKFNIADQTINSTTTRDTSYGDVDFVTGIEFVYSLGNHRAQADLKQAKLGIENLRIQYQITKNNYNKKLNQTITDIKFFKNSIKNKENIIASLESQQKTEKQKYNNGRIDLMSVLDTRNSISNENLNLMKNKISLIVAYLDFLSITE